MKKLLLTLLGILIGLPTFARVFEYTYEGQTLKYTVLDEEAKTCETKYGKRIAGDLIIPSIAMDGDTEYAVVQIGENSFENNEELNSVIIPGSVTAIGESAFRTCVHLTSVEIPNSVITIGYSAFENCSWLTSVRIPDSLTRIQQYTFYGCSGLVSIEIPNSVTDIEWNAFQNCTGLTSVIIGNSVTFIGADAFKGCTGLKKSAYPNTINNPFRSGFGIAYDPEGSEIEDGFVYGPGKSSIIFASCHLSGKCEIPNSVTSICSRAFEGCTGLTSVVIGDSVTSIDSSAFKSCTGLTSVVIGDSVTSIGSSAFEGCTGLPSVVIGDSVTSIGSSAFEGCIGLTSVVIGESVTSIGSSAFEGCTGLPSVVIGDSVTSIGSSAFKGCTGLTSVMTTSVDPAFLYETAFESLYDHVVLTIPEGTALAYFSTAWSLFKHVQESGNDRNIITSYYNDGKLNYLLLPALDSDEENIAVIISGNYSGEIEVPERFTDETDMSNPQRYYVKSIGYKAFYEKPISKISFNNRIDLKIIGDLSFRDCSELAEIVFPSTVTSIGDHSFYNCNKLTEIVFPSTVTSIGAYAFAHCSSLKTVELPEGLEIIREYTFKSSCLTEFICPNSVTQILAGAFEGCTQLVKITLGDKLESIGAKAFQYDPWDWNAKIFDNELFIPASIKYMGEDAWKARINKKVVIDDLRAWFNIDFSNKNANPIGITYRGDVAEVEYSGVPLTDLVIPDGVSEIKPYAFPHGLKSLTLLNSVISIREHAFSSVEGKVIIPESVVYIGYKAIESASEVIFQDGEEEIDNEVDAFVCRNLYMGRLLSNHVDVRSSLTVGNLLTHIADNLFANSGDLSAITFGSNIRSIGERAFSDCPNLKRVILPPAVETIGAEAFSGNSNLADIYMGHEVQQIGEKAFDGCPVSIVGITAQNPPVAPTNTFSTYSGRLFLQGQAAVDAYYDAYTCWDRFDSELMIEPTGMETTGNTTVYGHPGETVKLEAKLIPENVTLPFIFWHSTNPKIATVDPKGVVTFHVNPDSKQPEDEDEEEDPNDEDEETCSIIAESLYYDSFTLEFKIINSDFSAVDEVIEDRVESDIDFNAPVEVYNLNGVKIANSTNGLAKGIYILRQGKVVKKVAVK